MFAPVYATQPSSPARAPGRSATRVSRTSRRPTSVSWRRRSTRAAPGRRCRPREPRPSSPSARTDLAAEQRRHPDRAGALDDELAALHQQHHRLGGLVLAHDRHARRPTARAAARQLPRRLYRDPVGDRQRGVGDLHADHLDLRPGGLHRDRDAAAEPTAADRDDHLARSGTSSSSSSPRFPGLRRCLDRRTGGRTRARLPALARSRTRRTPRPRRRRGGRSRPGRAPPPPSRSARRRGRRPRSDAHRACGGGERLCVVPAEARPRPWRSPSRRARRAWRPCRGP